MSLRNIPCVIAHAIVQNLFYKADSPNGMTQDIRLATQYPDVNTRMAGLQEIYDRYPKANCKQLIFMYLQT